MLGVEPEAMFAADQRHRVRLVGIAAEHGYEFAELVEAWDARRQAVGLEPLSE